MPLTPKQQRFVSEYLIDLNATQAAIRAGYSPVTADKKAPLWVGKGRVSEAIAAAQKDREEATGITPAWVLRRLKREAEYEGEGSSHAARVSALALAAKHLGMLKEDAPHPDRPQYDLTRLSDHDKRTLLIAIRVARTGGTVPGSAALPPGGTGALGGSDVDPV